MLALQGRCRASLQGALCRFGHVTAEVGTPVDSPKLAGTRYLNAELQTSRRTRKCRGGFSFSVAVRHFFCLQTPPLVSSCDFYLPLVCLRSTISLCGHG